MTPRSYMTETELNARRSGIRKIQARRRIRRPGLPAWMCTGLALHLAATENA